MALMSMIMLILRAIGPLRLIGCDKKTSNEVESHDLGGQFSHHTQKSCQTCHGDLAPVTE
jgi:hypothetical protein